MKKYPKLTSQEIIITQETLLGKSSKQIAQALCITEHTVKAHLKSIFIKTGTKRRIELISKIFTILLKNDISTSNLNAAILTLIQQNFQSK